MTQRAFSRGVGLAFALLFSAPVAAGLVGVALPAFGHLPVLGYEGWSVEPFRRLAAMPGLAASVALSLAAGLATTLLSVLAVAAFVAGAFDTRAMRAGGRALGPLLAVPHAAAAFGLAFLIAPSGLIFRLLAVILGWDRPPDLLIVGDPLGLAMMAGLIVKEMPFLLLVALAALPQLDARRQLHLARSLGYGRLSAFMLGVWPSLYRQIRLPVLAVAAYASSVVDVALILGPSTPAPLAVRILEWMNDADLSLRLAASAGALLQLGVTLIVLLAWLGIERLGRVLSRAFVARGRRMAGEGALPALSLLPMMLAAATVLLSLVLLALWSFAGFWRFPDLLPPNFSLTAWERTLRAARGPLWTTAEAGLLAAAIALIVVVVLLEAHRRAYPVRPGDSALPTTVSAVVYLPLLVPQIAFLFGLRVAALSFGLSPSLGTLVAAHLLFVLPYVALSLSGPWAALDPRYERIGASLGRGRAALFFRLRLPLLLAPVLAAFAIGFSVSVGQYLPTVIIGAGRLPTVTTEAVALASGGDRRLVGAMALLQTVLPLIAFGLATALPVLLYRNRRAMRSS
ncbi:ABC transporter permease [Consotaella salsifontis]|uniref:Putative thiamine transport system permease protein n=1 Tax=Consotaella salsifontis TaxID=1365950 RepID=A0A1T4T8E8_9HYPH|nr:ABC transporter permease [Consotaella salsifontis]SKA36790.1 putative thiamine transport system permease protein [Consotaella salsifontis]